jgi:hypothetical protein
MSYIWIVFIRFMYLIQRALSSRNILSGRSASNSSIQKLYDAIVTTNRVKSSSSSSSLDGESRVKYEDSLQYRTNLHACMDLMETVSLEDIGVKEQQISRLKDAVCMTIVENKDFEIAVFILPS